jgi:hypothetical protein
MVPVPMSVAWSVDAVKNRRKTVTRRRIDKWGELQPGDRLTLTDGQTPLAKVEVAGSRVEPITLLTSDIRYGRQEVALEGMGHMTPEEFVEFWLRSYGFATWSASKVWCRRVERHYLG